MTREEKSLDERVLLVLGTYDGGVLGYEVLLYPPSFWAAPAAAKGSRQLQQQVDSGEQLPQVNGKDRGRNEKRAAAAAVAKEAKKTAEEDNKKQTCGAFKLLFAVTPHVGSVKAIACSKKWLLTGSSDECIRIYRLPSRREDGLLNTGVAGSITALALLDPFLISGDACGHLRVWSCNGWPLLCSFCTYQQVTARKRQQQRAKRHRHEEKNPQQKEEGCEQLWEEETQQGERDAHQQEQRKWSRRVGSRDYAAAAADVDASPAEGAHRTEVVRCPPGAAAARRRAAAGGKVETGPGLGKHRHAAALAAGGEEGALQLVPAGYGIRSIAVHPTGRACLVLCASGELQLWNLMQGICVVQQALDRSVEAVRWSLCGEVYALVYPSRASLFKATEATACMQVPAPADFAAQAAAREQQKLLQQKQQREQQDAGSCAAADRQQYPRHPAGKGIGGGEEQVAATQQQHDPVPGAATSFFVPTGTWSSVCFAADCFLLLGDSRGRVWGVPASDSRAHSDETRRNASVAVAVVAAAAGKKRKRLGVAAHVEAEKAEENEEENREEKRKGLICEGEEGGESRTATSTYCRPRLSSRRCCEPSHVFIGQHKLRVKGVELVRVQREAAAASSCASSSTAVTFVSADTGGSIHLWHFHLPEAAAVAAASAWPNIVSPIATVEARCRLTCVATSFVPPRPDAAAYVAETEQPKHQQEKQEEQQQQQRRRKGLQEAQSVKKEPDQQRAKKQLQERVEREALQQRNQALLQPQAKKKKQKRLEKQGKNNQKRSRHQELRQDCRTSEEREAKERQQASDESRQSARVLVLRKDGHKGPGGYQKGAAKKQVVLLKKIKKKTKSERLPK